MIFQFDDYRTFMKSLLGDRVAKNPRYSLRALAGQLGIAPSMLSEVLAGKKNLSPEMAEIVSRNLDLHDSEQDYFSTLVQFELAKTETLKLKLQDKLSALNPRRRNQDLSLDVFKAISDWYHIPILELCSVANEKLTAPTISKKLGLSRFETEAALDRLMRLELVEKRADGTFRKVDDDLVAKSLKPNGALRNFHKQMLTKALAAIEAQSNEEKFIGSETFAFDRKDLKKIEAAIEECFTKVIAISKKGSRRKDVYHCGIQFFNLCQGDKK